MNKVNDPVNPTYGRIFYDSEDGKTYFLVGATRVRRSNLREIRVNSEGLCCDSNMTGYGMWLGKDRRQVTVHERNGDLYLTLAKIDDIDEE